VRQLPRIAEQLVAHGRDPGEPAAIVERGTLPDQRVLRTTLAGLGDQDAHAPAVTLVGPVAALHDELAWFADGPLAGVSVAVTRARVQSSGLAARLRALGARVVEAPTIRIEPLAFDLPDLRDYDLLVLTSPNAVEALMRRAHDARALSGPKIAVIGPGTADALRAHGIEPAFVPRISSQDGLIAEFPRPAGRVLFAAAEGARRRPIDALGADFVSLYRTRLLAPEPPDGDVVVLASGSAARAYAAVGGSAPAVTIGAETSRVARTVGLAVAAEAVTHDLDGLVDAVGRAVR